MTKIRLRDRHPPEVFTVGKNKRKHKNKNRNNMKRVMKSMEKDCDEGGSCKMHERSKNSGYREVFDSGFAILKVEDLVVKIPLGILAVCNTIQEKVGSNEFSIFTKGRYAGNGYIIANEYIIPEQEVSGAAVDYCNEDDGVLRSQGWNVVIHSHPFNMHTFSSSDEETINSHFEASLLYSQGKFVNAVLNIALQNAKLQLKPKLCVDATFPVVEVDTTKIKTKSWAYNKSWADEAAESDASKEAGFRMFI